MDLKAYLTAPVPRWLALTAVISTGVAATGVTYFTTRRRFYDQLDQMVEDTVEKTRKFYATVEKAKTPTEILAEREYEAEANDEELVEEAKLIIDANAYLQADDDSELVQVAHNVFTNAKDTEFDPADIQKRTPDKPYIITHDEFFESENQMITLTWFEGDEVLADEKDEHIPDINRVVGEDNLLRFGYGSGDPNILYVRNEKMEVDFEVVKNDGKYTEQVMGFIQHDEPVRPRKFRTYDD